MNCRLLIAVTQKSTAIPWSFNTFLHPASCHALHTAAVLNRKKFPSTEPKDPVHWPTYNNIIYPPRDLDEPQRPAEIFHFKSNIKYSYKKLWYIAAMVRGMSVDEATKQLSFMERKGSISIRDTIVEAQELAVKNHGVEYKSNLWIAESFVGKAKVLKGLRRHARQRSAIIHYRYTHYFLCLREGPPPQHYYQPRESGNELMADYVQNLRNRRIISGL